MSAMVYVVPAILFLVIALWLSRLLAGKGHEETPSYYELLEGVLTLVAGLALVFTAQTWARKLTRAKPDKVVEPAGPE